MGKPARYPIRRSIRSGKKGNILRNAMRIQIVERVYEGSPRFADPPTHYEDPHLKLKPPYDRDSDLEAWMRTAWGENVDSLRDNPIGNFFAGVKTLRSCVNPECKQRLQLTGSRPKDGSVRFHRSPDVKCGGCGKPVYWMLYRPIEKKWVYVFRGTPGRVRLFAECYAETPEKWLVRYSPGETPRSKRKFTRRGRGSGIVEADEFWELEGGNEYQFFLSPNQLGLKAIRKLVRWAKRGPNKRPSNKPNKAEHNVEQLDNVTLRRQIHNPATYFLKRTRAHEIVPVLDPFAWVKEMNQYDYRLILAALYELRANPRELAKLSMATILNSLVGKDLKDTYDLIDELVKTASKLPGQHAAKKYFEYYNQCTEFLSQQTRDACLRLIEWLDSDCHWIVESNCFENDKDPNFLLHVLTHYDLVLRDILGCPAGEVFAERLSYKEKKRFIYRYILNPQKREREALARARKQIGHVDVANLINMLPVIIRNAHKNEEAEDVVKHLKSFGINAKVTGKVDERKPLGFKTFDLAAGTVINIQKWKIEKFGRGLLPQRWYEKHASRIQQFVDLKTSLIGLFDILTEAKIYSEKPKPYESMRSVWLRNKAQVEYPVKVAGFLVEQGKVALAYYANRQLGVDVAAFSRAMRAGETYYLASESVDRIVAHDYRRFNRMLKVYNRLDKVSNVFAGPVALFFGGIDLVVQDQNTINNWKDGDYGAALGSGMMAAAAVITVSSSIVSTLALFNVSWALAYEAALGPLGIIAALLTLLAVFIFAYWSKSELEKFANHCFLGTDYGKGSDDGPRWAKGESFATWSKGKNPLLRQNSYLVNLISTYTVTINTFKPTGDLQKGWTPLTIYGALIRPGYLPPGAKAEVEVISEYLNERGQRTKLKGTAIVSLDSGEYIYKGADVKGVFIEAYPSNSWGQKEFSYFTIRIPHKLKSGWSKIRYKEGFLKGHERYLWEVRVRLDITGSGHFLPLGKDKYVVLSSQEQKGWGAVSKSSLDDD